MERLDEMEELDEESDEGSESDSNSTIFFFSYPFLLIRDFWDNERRGLGTLGFF